MQHQQPRLKTGVKAVIVREGQLLTVVKQYPEGIAHILPGGSQNHGEPLDVAVARECREELGAEVTVERLLFVREYIGANHEHAHVDSHLHIVDLLFACSVPDGYTPQMGHEPDPEQIGVRWLPIAELHQHQFYPAALQQLLLDGASDIYIGDIN